MHEGMPTATEQHKKLSALAGKWTAEEKLYPSPWDPQGGTAMGRIESRIDLDGFCLISEYVQERGGKVSYRGHGVYQYDPRSNRYLMHWFDSMGMTAREPAEGIWEGNTLRFESATPMGRGRYSYIFEGDGRYTFKMEHSQDGKEWCSFMEGRYTRK